MKKPSSKTQSLGTADADVTPADYTGLVGGIADLLETARRTSARAVNALMTASYWEIGRRIVEFEQGGTDRAKYGDAVVDRLSEDLSARLGRGHSRRNVFLMRAFYLVFPQPFLKPGASSTSPDTNTQATGLSRADGVGMGIVQTLSAQSASSANPLAPMPESGEAPIGQTVSAKSDSPAVRSTPPSISETPSSVIQAVAGRSQSSPFSLSDLARAFPLPWSHYVLLVSHARSPEAIEFYHAEALRGGWSVRQLRRQIESQFYERVALSRNKAAMLAKGSKPLPGDAVSADEEIKDPLVLEFLALRDEYSESDLEDALIRHLEQFLLELGNDFAFIARQRRLRIDNDWYRVDLLFFHRRLRCLVVIDLKLGRFTHADAGQMHLYLNYAVEHWTQPDENPPVGIILCAGKGEALVHYATENLPTKVLVREYLTALPNVRRLADEIDAARKQLETKRG